jgi:hypothetical protein
MMNGMQHTSAFVIQFLFRTDLEAKRCEGRVEHVASGQAMHFQSVDELLSFLDRVLKETRAAQNELT